MTLCVNVCLSANNSGTSKAIVSKFSAAAAAAAKLVPLATAAAHYQFHLSLQDQGEATQTT